MLPFVAILLPDDGRRTVEELNIYGTQLNRAHLRGTWRRVLNRADSASTVAPYAGGIHRISNRSSRSAISVHLYGPRVGSLDGRDYDPSHDYVCDRYEGELPNPCEQSASFNAGYYV